jgi:mannonate dehydratase
MRFDFADFAAFDIHILRRRGAADSFPPELVELAGQRYALMDEARKRELATNVVFGLPGAADHMTLEDVRVHLEEYRSIDADRLSRHFHDFLEQVAPVAQEVGIRMCCHPDDPPYPLLGLPRIMSTEADYTRLMRAVDLPANGITLCAGSLGARADNDLPGMMRRLGDRVHFLHLRNVRRETDALFGSFHEAEHLGGNTDMVALLAEVVREERRRKAEGRPDCSIPFRPDHGQDILDDLKRKAQPGYPAIGRLRGLAELRGIVTALEHAGVELAA